MRTLALAPLLLMACSVLDQTYAGLDDPPASSTDGENSDDTTNFPEPTTGTTTGHHSQDMGAEPETTEAPAYAEILEFSANTNQMLRAGSVVLTAEVVGEHTELSLLVHRDGEPVGDEIWPLGEANREYIVSSDALDGELTFTLQALVEGEVLDSEKLSVEVDLPESGTKDFRWVSPAVSRGMALGVVPGSGTEADTIVAVGNDFDDVLLMGVMEYGAVAMVPFPRLKVHAVDVADGFIFVAGEHDGKMEIRKYTADTLQQYWYVTFPDARAFDVAFGPDGDVYVVGETDVEGMFPHTQATIWVYTESGALRHHAQFAKNDDQDLPLASAMHAVGFLEERVVAVGYREEDVGDIVPRATLFEFVEGQLLDSDVYSGAFAEEECGWHALVTTSDGVVSTGWHRNSDMDPSSVAFGRHGEDLVGEVFSPAWGGFGAGNAIAWQDQGEGYPVIAGQRTVGLEPRLLVQAEPWGQPYIDDGGDRSWARDVVIDRHGYIYAVGDLVENGEPHLVLVRLNP